jgi:hypothetical protein
MEFLTRQKNRYNLYNKNPSKNQEYFEVYDYNI